MIMDQQLWTVTDFSENVELKLLIEPNFVQLSLNTITVQKDFANLLKLELDLKHLLNIQLIMGTTSKNYKNQFVLVLNTHLFQYFVCLK